MLSYWFLFSFLIRFLFPGNFINHIHRNHGKWNRDWNDEWNGQGDEVCGRWNGRAPPSVGRSPVNFTGLLPTHGGAEEGKSNVEINGDHKNEQIEMHRDDTCRDTY